MSRNTRCRRITSHAAAMGMAVAIAAGAQSVTPRAGRAQQAAIPTPESVFGFSVGADYKLINYEQSIAYFKQLAAASDHMKLITVGTTAYGRPWTVAIISSPQNLAQIDHYRQINMRLAHPEGLTDSAARALAQEGRVFVDISGGLHASEIAGSQHTIQLAYDLLSQAGDSATQAIFDNVIFFLWPSINPDGQDIVVNWCDARHAGKSPGPMELYEKYIGHDNNRDSYMLNVIESRVIQRTWRHWEPDIIYVHHQSSPFPTRIWVPPFADPVGMHAPPIPAREVNVIGTRIALALDEHEEPGATSLGSGYDAWYPGYIDYMPIYQNIPSWWTETQGGNCGIPRTTTLDSLPPDYRDLRPTPMYLSPWTQGTWHLRDAVDYMVTASKATLRYAALHREEVLYDRYESGRDVIHKYQTSAPYAYIIPQQQSDPMAPVQLLRRLAFMGIRISQMQTPLAYEGTTYPKGTWVIPMDQEYAELVRELLDVQHYPDLGSDQPYDAAGWTLPMQMNVKVVAGKTPLSSAFRAALAPVEGTPVDWHTAPNAPFTTNAEAAGVMPLPGAVTGSGNQLALDPAQNNTFRFVNRALAARGKVRFEPAGAGHGARYLVSDVKRDSLNGWVKTLAIHATRARSSSASEPVPTRIALFKESPGIIDQGWTQWLFDTFGFKYTLVTPADLRAGRLNSRFDVIVLASQGLTRQRGRRRGGRRGNGNAAPDSAAADSVVAAVDAFVRGGGTVVAWSQGVDPAIRALHLPVKDMVAGIPRSDYFTGISIMRVITDPMHPVMAGMPDTADVVVNRSPVLTTLDGFEGAVLARYSADASPLRSGWLNGAKYMEGGAAAMDVKHGQGHVVLLAYQPQWRGQSTGTFRTVFNSAFFAGAVAQHAKGTPGFWTAPAASATSGSGGNE
ncbi:MAG TPA: M14 metallopeptidase family protein [Gemmatimonadaceae bacterium]|nr:M14 metallopeptidase family protein [Gemmatimonadaceae bacterium]